MERALRGLMEAVGVKPDEAMLRRQLDAWYGSRPEAPDRLTPQQNRALEQAHAKAMDRSMADVERQARRNVAGMDTRQLIATAEALDAELVAKDTGPLVRGEIARTLLAMHGELDRRIRAAPLDDRGLPKLEGVRWEDGDPLAGITEAIGPFGKIDLWTLASLESPPPEDRAADDTTRERIPPDAAERAERERVATPSDGVGFAFGADWPDPGEWARFWEAKGSELQIGLLDPGAMVVVEGMASAPGTDAANLALGQRRANNVKALLMAAGIPEDRILVVSYGEGPARSANGRDRAEHRIARVGTAGGVIGRDAPAPEQEVPLKTSIPEQYTPPDRYPTSEREARRLARSPDEYYERVKKPWTLPRSPGGLAREILRGVPRALSETGNFTAWCEKMRGDASQDQKLWETPPPSPLRTLKGQAPFRGIVEYQLKRGGYDPKTMYDKYLIHWFRRGVR